MSGNNPGNATTTALVLAPPESSDSKALATIADSSVTRKALSCTALLKGDTLKQAKVDAAALYPQMKQNTQVVMTYGTSALEGVNSLIERLLDEVEPEKIPELTQLMKNLNGEMRGIKNKYDVSDPKVRKKYESAKRNSRTLFNGFKTFFELLMEDATKVETQLDKVSKTLIDREYKMTRNVAYYDQLYVQNEAEITKLIYAIAVMELTRDIAANEADKIQVGNADLGDRGYEQKSAIAELAQILDNRIIEYKGRLWFAWATAPQIRTMRSLNVSLSMRVNTLLTITIPNMKGTVVQWRMLMQSKDAADMSSVVAEASNEWAQAYAAAGAVVVPQIAQVVNTPTLEPATIYAMANSIDQQADGIVKAIEAGAQQRAVLENAMVQAKQVLDGAATKVTDAVIDRVVASAKPLEISTQVLNETAAVTK